VLECVRSADAGGMALWVAPSGPVRAGTTISLNCRVTAHHPLDVVRLVRVVDDVAYELTTNELLSATFRDTGRYRIVDYDAGTRRYVRLQISREHGRVKTRLGPPDAAAVVSRQS